MEKIEIAMHTAFIAHAGQKDKAGEPYIFHLLRVMMKCTSTESKIAALLHDSVEDEKLEFRNLEEIGFEPEILEVIKLLTHFNGVPYDDYIAALMVNPLAVEVKIADLEDNLDVKRMTALGPHGAERVQKYLTAYHRLKDRQLETLNSALPRPVPFEAQAL